jgi:hypothetical protein
LILRAAVKVMANIFHLANMKLMIFKYLSNILEIAEKFLR